MTEKLDALVQPSWRCEPLLAALFFLCCGCDPNANPPASPQPAGPAPAVLAKFKAADPQAPLRTFDQIVALPDEQFDVAEAVLALAAESKPEHLAAGTKETLQALDEMAAKAEDDLPENPDGSDYFDTLYEVVLQRRNAESYREDRAEDYDLSWAVQKRRGSCLSVGIMTLAVARRIGAPVWGVQCPTHFFLRYQPKSAGDKLDTLNFDVTKPTPENWRKLDDTFYRRWRHIGARAEAAGAYLRSLTDRQVVSAFLASRSGYFALQKRFEESVKDADRALALNPRNLTAMINAGYALEALGKLQEAEASYRKALALDSQSVRALNNLAYLKGHDSHSAVYNFKEAHKLIEAALSIDPDQASLYATSAEIFAARGNYRDATILMQKASSLAPKNSSYHERFLFFREQIKRETK